MPMISAMPNTDFPGLPARQQFGGQSIRLFLLLLPLALSGCAALQPLVSDFNIVSVDEENQLSQKMSAEIAKSMKLSADATLNQKVNTVGNKLVAALPSKQFNYRFYVVEEPSPNAFTIPGAGIYVHTGLFKLATSEGELAGVLAHEIGHAYERHPAKGISRQYGLEYVSGLLFKQNKNQLQQLALNYAKGGILNKYGRGDEREADDIAFDLLRKSGYSPDGLILFFKKLQQISKGSGVPEFLSSHPPTPERIERLEQLKLQTTHVSRV